MMSDSIRRNGQNIKRAHGRVRKKMAEEKKNQDDMNNEMTFEERQYERLINARNFHYENFNKWSLYFYAIIAALFVGYYSLEAKATEIDNIILWCILGLGFIVSMCCHLSGKGYYYWEINWIKLIIHYEKQVWPLKKEESVYSIFANEKDLNHYWNLVVGANISSSKLSLVVSFAISYAWAAMITMKLLHEYTKCPCCVALALLGALAVTWILSGSIGKALHSDLKNHDDLQLPAKEERKNS